MKPLSETKEDQSLRNVNENRDQNTKFLIRDGSRRLRDSQSDPSVPQVYIEVWSYMTILHSFPLILIFSLASLDGKKYLMMELDNFFVCKQ